jgi:hypothetical protein
MQPQLASSLWHRAPLWRYCCFAGAGLTILALGLPYLKQTGTGSDKVAVMTVRSDQQAVAPGAAAVPVKPDSVPKAHPSYSSMASSEVPAPATKKKEHPAVAEHAQAPMMLTQEHAVQSRLLPDSREAVVSNVGNSASTSIPAKTPTKSPRGTLPPVQPSQMVAGDPTGILAELDASAQQSKEHCMTSSNRVSYRSTVPGMTNVHLANEGMWCFFDPSNQLSSVRIEAPFTAAVDGVKIGDSLEQVNAVLGASVKNFPFADSRAYLYFKNPKTFERFDVHDGVVRAIFVGKRE